MSEIKQYGKVAITFEGDYKQGKSYDRLSIVEYAGMSFLSKVDGANSIPTQNKNQWIQLSVPGPQGPIGEKGEQGLRGEKGDYGAKGISTRTVFVYKHSETEPDKPIGGSVDFVGGLITYPEGWQSSDNIPAPVWRSERTFFEDNSIQDDWTTPMKMTGDNGRNGVDGVNMEFIYKVTKRPSIVPDISNMPSINVDDYVPVEFGWSDSPNGVSPTNRIEWVCTRKKINGVWSNWEGPTIWSAYGEKGQDGDGVEYIFYLDDTGNPPNNPTPSDWEYNDEYQNPDVEYVPTELGWTDVATGISQDKRFEWQCSRKFKNGFWQPFEGPYLWSKYGDKGNIGDRIIEKYAVTEDHNPPNVEKNKPNPGSIWSIAPPETFDPSTGGAIWKIYTYIDYKNELVEWETVEENETIKHIGWSDPIIQSGYNGEDGISPNWRTYIYKQSDTKPELPTFTDPTKFEEAGWKDSPYDDVTGDNVVDIEGRWWECSGLVNGESKEVEWQYIREINGSNSKSLFQVTSSRVQPSLTKENNNPGDPWKETYTMPNVYQYLWMITAEIDAQGNLVGEWQGPTCITGESPKIEDNGDITIGGEPTGANVLNLHLELDNDSETIPTNSKGNTIGTVSAITTAQLYNGSKLITEGVTYSAVATKCTLNETKNTTGIFEVISLDSGTDITGYYVEITANYKDKNITKKFNISKSLGNLVYKLIFDKNIVNLDQSDKTVYIRVKYTDGNNEGFIKSLTTNSLGIKADGVLLSSSNYNETTGISITISKTTNVELYSYLFDSNGILQDSETIGVVKDGTDGTNAETYYLHIAYCDNPTNTSDNSDFVLQSSGGVTDKEYRGEYTSTNSIASTNKSDYTWTKYRGEPGQTGPGGIPGVSIYLRYCLGTADAHITSSLPSTSDGTGTDWYAEVPTTNETYPYIWCTQGQKVYSDKDTYSYSWSTPFRLQGINGLDGIGDKGDPGRVIYPAGIYADNVSYVATSTKAPYVWDPNYGAFYVYLSETVWLGTDQGITPGDEYAANNASGTNKWELFEQFEAVYAKLGIIANGLIGSAVFNGDYMFSQQGVDVNGNPSTGTSYEYFMLSSSGEQLDHPYNTNAKFRPNTFLNFKTGEFSTAKGFFHAYITSDGISNISLGNMTNPFNTAYGGKSHYFSSNGTFMIGGQYGIYKTSFGNIFIANGKIKLIPIEDSDGNIEDYTVKLGSFEITDDGLRYIYSIDGDEYEDQREIKITKDGVCCEDRHSGINYWNLTSDGSVQFLKEKINFNIDGTWNIGTFIKQDSDSINIGPYEFNTNSAFLDKSVGHINLSNGTWPSADSSMKGNSPIFNKIYLYNSVKFTNAYTGTAKTMDFKYGIQWLEGKYIELTILNDLGIDYYVNLTIGQYNSDTIYNIIGGTQMTNGDLSYPTEVLVSFIRLLCGNTYIFYCEGVYTDGVLTNKIMRYIGKK